LQKNLSKIEAAGVHVAGISYDSVDVLRLFSAKRNITFPLLSDPDSKVIMAYSLRNKEVAGQKVGKINPDGIPYPGTIIVDREGVIRAKLFRDGYAQRHSPDELVEAAKALQKR
jgi:peroxiredoxin Q/BCP